MKSFKISLLLSLGVCFSLSATAAPKTVLHVPFFIEVRSGNPKSPSYKYVSVAKLNKTLQKKGIPQLLEFVDFSLDTKFNKYDFNDKIDAAIDAAGIKNAQSFGEYVPAQYSDELESTCYRGDGNGVVDIVLANVDNLYSDQFSLIGWKFGKKSYFGQDSDSDNKDGVLSLNKDSKAWKDYNTNSDSVLILASVGDGGDDVNESLIPRCK